jgi:hypothetical protein
MVRGFAPHFLFTYHLSLANVRVLLLLEGGYFPASQFPLVNRVLGMLFGVLKNI